VVLWFFLLFFVVVAIFSVVVVGAMVVVVGTGVVVVAIVVGATVVVGADVVVGATVIVVNSTVVVVGATVVVVVLVVVIGTFSQAIAFPIYFKTYPASQASHSTAPCSGQKKLSTTPFGHSQTFKTHLLFFMWYS